MKEREVKIYYPPSSLPSELSLRREVAVEIMPKTWVEGCRSQVGSLPLTCMDRAWKIPCLPRGARYSIQYDGAWPTKQRLLRVEPHSLTEMGAG